MLEEGLDVVALKKLDLPKKQLRFKELEYFCSKKNTSITIGLIGKYVEMQDCYKSILEAFIHAGASNETKVNIISIHSDILMLLKKKLKALMVFL
jgi:CTP synthase